jgi:hypothetical protein
VVLRDPKRVASHLVDGDFAHLLSPRASSTSLPAARRS